MTLLDIRNADSEDECEVYLGNPYEEHEKETGKDAIKNENRAKYPIKTYGWIKIKDLAKVENFRNINYIITILSDN